MRIRPATPDDAEAIAAIYNDAIVNTTAILWHTPKPVSLWRERLTGRPSAFPVLVAEDESGAVVGFALLGPYDDKCGYKDVAEWSLYIDQARRGKGVGRSLADALFDKARADGRLHSVLSRVTAGNEASFRLHDRLGFTKVGTFKGLGEKFGERHDVVVYQLLLQQ
ncbi:MAG: GNAT family N-acetyltransferase [Phycisphaeraceae bacterium]